MGERKGPSLERLLLFVPSPLRKMEGYRKDLNVYWWNLGCLSLSSRGDEILTLSEELRFFNPKTGRTMVLKNNSDVPGGSTKVKMVVGNESKPVIGSERDQIAGVVFKQDVERCSYRKSVLCNQYVFYISKEHLKVSNRPFVEFKTFLERKGGQDRCNSPEEARLIFDKYFDSSLQRESLQEETSSH